ncbi:MAG: DNA polymerase III subunit delta [Planctomycetota bacterium]
MARKPSASSAPLGADVRIAVLHGKDAFVRSDKTRELKAALLEAHGDIDTLYFDGQTTDVADVLDECRSFGLMQQHKLVLVDQADQFVKDASRALIERYAESPADGATLVLRGERWNRGKLDKLIEAVGAVVKCDAYAPAQCVQWAGERAKAKHGCKLERDAAILLVERIGNDLGKIDTELGKLAASQAPGAAITEAAVHELVGASKEEDAWSVQSVLLSGDASRIVRHLRAILDNAPRDAHIPVSYACVDLARKLHAASCGVRAGAPANAIASKLKLWGPARDAVLAAASRVDPDRGRELLRACIEADAGLKSGLGKPDRVLEVIATRYAAAMSR